MKQFSSNLGSASGSGASLQIPLNMNDGGSGRGLTPVAGAIVWTDVNSMEISAAGTSGQVLQSTGTTAPIWVSGGQTLLTLPLAMSEGGTGQSLASSLGGVVYTDANSMEVLAAGTSGQILQSRGAASPVWLTYEAFNSPLAMNKGGTGQSLAPTNGGVVWTDANSMEVSAAGTSGQYLQSGGATTPVWITPPVGFSLQLPVPLSLGGTNNNISASLGAIAFSSTSTIALLAIGTSGQVLQSNGLGSVPTWITPGTGLATPLAMNLGGTGQSLAPSAGAVVYTDVNSMEVSAVGTSGQYLQSNGAGAPSWADVAYRWTAFTMTPAGTVSAPTFGTGASSMAFFRYIDPYKREMEVMWRLTQTAAGIDGSGAYLFPVPDSRLIDVSITGVSPTGTATITTMGAQIVGYGYMANTTAGDTIQNVRSAMVVFGATCLGMNGEAGSGPDRSFPASSSNLTRFSTNPFFIGFYARFPVV